MNNRVYALAVSGSDLYAAGRFMTAGGSPATRIAKWNGSSWSALGSGMDLSVYVLAVSGSDRYAGGRFQTAGGVSVGNGLRARKRVQAQELVELVEALVHSAYVAAGSA